MRRRDILQLLPLSLPPFVIGIQRALTEEHYCIRRKDIEDAPSCPLQGPPSNPLGITYTEKTIEMLTWIRGTQSENLLEAAHVIADRVMKKKTCWYCWDMGHSTKFDIVPGRNGLPEIFTVGYDPEKTQEGDLYLNNIDGTHEEDIRKKNIFMIGAPVPWGCDAKGSELIVLDSAKYHIRPYSNIWIDSTISTTDAVIHIPGMPAPIGPFSGIIGMVTFWMMMADTCRILARHGVSVPVQGDEPVLTGSSIQWANLDEPLMDDYFEQVFQQIEMIGAEFGNIHTIAQMAVDSVLAGGRVYCYSRYSDALSAEASTRRGGLALTQGIHEVNGKIVWNGQELKGTSKDLVIMGIFSPNDPFDLDCLTMFRKSGMKVASMRPITRDIKVPEGRTISKETDVHVGRMCDTYGLYAFPGFERKVCPTSGALLNQIFWATSIEIAEELLRRTGNAPGVFFSAAIKGGVEHMHRMHELYRERGY